MIIHVVGGWSQEAMMRQSSRAAKKQWVQSTNERLGMGMKKASITVHIFPIQTCLLSGLLWANIICVVVRGSRGTAKVKPLRDTLWLLLFILIWRKQIRMLIWFDLILFENHWLLSTVINTQLIPYHWQSSCVIAKDQLLFALHGTIHGMYIVSFFCV